ncbi:MAG: chromosome partitioning protein ParB [Opitutae bacterium]
MNTLLDGQNGDGEVELAQLDLRYESYRIKNAVREARLLGSIAQRGIQEPLQGVAVGEVRCLLDGFARYRCARKLQIHKVPYLSLGADEASGILRLLRSSHPRTLSLLEQAGFVDELRNARQLSVAEMATTLGVSKGWINMRLGLMGELSPKVRPHLFNGSFPVYAYMYVVRSFRRMKGVKPEHIEEFVGAVSGHHLSVRDIEQLAHGYFRGPPAWREEIGRGNLAVPLAGIKQAAADPQGCSEFERVLLNDLGLTQKYMQRVMGKCLDPQIQSRTFHAQSHLLTAGILSRTRAFFHTVRQLHDRNGQA